LDGGQSGEVVVILLTAFSLEIASVVLVLTGSLPSPNLHKSLSLNLDPMQTQT